MKIIIVLLSLPLIVLGCSNSSSTNGGAQQSTQMHWQVGARSSYIINGRDTAKNSFDMDQTNWYDTITRTIISTGGTYDGKSNVVEYRDSDAHMGIQSYGYMAQDIDGTVWIEGFGANAWINYFSHTFINVGWVKVYSPPEGTWENDINIGEYMGSVDTHVLYSESKESDTQITLQGKTYTAKHILHTITTFTEGYASFFTVYVDSYIVFDLGMPVVEIDHSFRDWVDQPYEGTTTRMVSYTD